MSSATRCVISVVVSFGAASAPASAQVPYLVKDIFPGPMGGTSSLETGKSASLGSRLFFRAAEGINGAELWVSNGTEAGTYLVADIAPGPANSTVNSMAAFKGRLFFQADDGVNGAELWVSDGTPQGTFLLKDIRPGAEGSFPSESVCAQCGGLVSTRDFLFFAANDGVNGRQLWRTDGTPKGTVMVLQLSTDDPQQFGVLDNLVYFRQRSPTTNLTELWKSDGTAEGTMVIRPSTQGGPLGPSRLTPVAGTLFFTATDRDEDFGRELWKTDGTPEGTLMVIDLNPGPGGSFPAFLTDVDGTLFFGAFHPEFGAELFKTDGTGEGTVLIKDIHPTGGALTELSVPGVALVGDTFFFGADDGVHGMELWKTDGTEEGTVMVADINPDGGAFEGTVLGTVGGVVYFVADDGVHGREPWRSDGTQEGTWLAKDIYPGPGESIPFASVVAGQILYFTGVNPDFGRELWAVDGRMPAIPVLSPLGAAIGGGLMLLLGWIVIARRVRVARTSPH